MKTIGIIGGGASGMVASIYASKKENKVTILERNDIIGKKILVTGNGRCNYFNSRQNLSYYHSDNFENLEKIITIDRVFEVEKFIRKIGIIPKIKDGYYYPFSNQAATIRNALLIELKHKNVEIKTNVLVKDVRKDRELFEVITNDGTMKFDKVIITTGSIASFKKDYYFNGYQLATNFKHSITPVLPALVQLEVLDDKKFLKKWAGVRSDAVVSLYEDGKLIKEEVGEVQFTDYGISGICVFNLSRFVSRGLYLNVSEVIKINFLPNLSSFDINDCLSLLEEQDNLAKDRTIRELLAGILNEKLVDVILDISSIDGFLYFNDLTDLEKVKLASNLISFEVKITATRPYSCAQVVTGGVKLDEIDSDTMESKLVKGLYFAGEILDVDGDCGGYNLTFAFLSGMLAGISCGER